MARTIQQISFPAPMRPSLKRVAAYARVSSGKDAMLHSLSAQVSYWARAGEMLGAMDEGSYEPISSGSGTSVVYDLSGLSFSPTIKVDGNTDEDALIRKLRDLEPEFIDFILEALARREGGAYVTADSRLY